MRRGSACVYACACMCASNLGVNFFSRPVFVLPCTMCETEFAGEEGEGREDDRDFLSRSARCGACEIRRDGWRTCRAPLSRRRAFFPVQTLILARRTFEYSHRRRFGCSSNAVPRIHRRLERTAAAVKLDTLYVRKPPARSSIQPADTCRINYISVNAPLDRSSVSVTTAGHCSPG